MNIYKLLSPAILLLLTTQINSLDIHVSATNKTTGVPLKYADKVTILKLSETMQSVSEKTDTVLPAVFKGLPPMENAPYMVQINHKGVNYNKVIPPITAENSLDIKIDVYDTTYQFTPDIKMETFIEIYYYTGVLATDITHHITNTGRLTFTERGSQNGILTYISKNGKNLEAQATLETLHSTSNIKTLKLHPQPLPDKPGYYLLDQPVKPGEKYYQTRAHYKYEGDPLEIVFENIYPLNAKPTVILHAKEMKIQWKENPAWNTTAVFNENLGAEVFQIPNQPGKFTLVISGGIPEQGSANTASESSKPVEVLSPVNKYVKAAGLAIFSAMLIGFFMYISSRPVWLQIIQSKNKSRLEFELSHLKNLNIAPDVKAKKEKKIREKIESLNKLFKT